jgi:hypothetical protein
VTQRDLKKHEESLQKGKLNLIRSHVDSVFLGFTKSVVWSHYIGSTHRKCRWEVYISGTVL